MWKKAVGNSLHLTKELYEILVHQAQQMKEAKAKKIEACVITVIVEKQSELTVDILTDES